MFNTIGGSYLFRFLKAKGRIPMPAPNRPTNVPDDFDDIGHLAALVDLHPVLGRRMVAVHESAYEEVKKALAAGKDLEIIKVDFPPGDLQVIATPPFLGWAFNLPKAHLGLPREHVDRPPTWNPLEDAREALDFMQLYRILSDPRHTVRYVLGLKCPPKRPRKDQETEREHFTCDLCGTHGMPSAVFPRENICTACSAKRMEAEKQDQTTEEKTRDG
jgi:hypothetical protein